MRVSKTSKLIAERAAAESAAVRPVTPDESARGDVRRDLTDLIYKHACSECSYEKLQRQRTMAFGPDGKTLRCLLLVHAYPAQMSEADREVAGACPVIPLYARVHQNEVTELTVDEIVALRPDWDALSKEDTDTDAPVEKPDPNSSLKVKEAKDADL